MLSKLSAAALILLAVPERVALSASDYAADAGSIERLINEQYAYLDRFPGEAFRITDKLRSEAMEVKDLRGLTRYAERSLMLLADHHAITGASLPDSWGLVPSFADLWVEPHGQFYVIEAVREGSPGEQAGIKPGDRLLAVEETPIRKAVADFWANLGATGDPGRNGFAARVLAAGRRDRARNFLIGRQDGKARKVSLPNLYAVKHPPRPPVSVSRAGDEYRIRFNDSLGDTATIAAFDAAMSGATRNHRLVIDLRDTPGGGNTTVARAVLGWFVTGPTSYQVHRLPSEEKSTGVARQWVEQVLPRAGKSYRGPVTIRVGRWTGSMGEGLAIGFDSIGAKVEGGPMAGLLGAIYDFRLDNSGFLIKLPAERLYSVNGTPREKFLPNLISLRDGGRDGVNQPAVDPRGEHR